MPLRKELTRTFDRCLYGTILQKVTFYKRDDDQRQGQVRTIKIFGCRRSSQVKAGETIQGDMVVDHSCRWQIPSRELRRVGIKYINNLDRIKDESGRFWQPEATTSIEVKLFENFVFFNALRVDPPSPPAPKATTTV